MTIRPGKVTGFLGPNGAGKSTTMRAIVGLDRPDAGDVLIGGRRYADDPAPLHTVGALLDARAFHPGRSARAHLRALAATQGIGRHRVDEVLDMVGLRDVADRRVGGFSLGMGQRLGIAAALLGDPEVVLLDEPVNGLDPDGVRWIRDLLRRLAGEGRTVFVSSHLMSEMALTADHLVVLGRGRLLADVSLAELTARADGRVLVRSPQPVELSRLLAAPGVTVTHDRSRPPCRRRAQQHRDRADVAGCRPPADRAHPRPRVPRGRLPGDDPRRRRVLHHRAREGRRMTTTVLSPSRPAVRVTPRGVVIAEWIKLRSLRSAAWLLVRHRGEHRRDRRDAGPRGRRRRPAA